MSPALVNGSGGGGGGSTGALTLRRGPIAAEFQGPGPAAVALPSTIGKKNSPKKKDSFLNYHLWLLFAYKTSTRHGMEVVNININAASSDVVTPPPSPSFDHS